MRQLPNGDLIVSDEEHEGIRRMIEAREERRRQRTNPWPTIKLMLIVAVILAVCIAGLRDQIKEAGDTLIELHPGNPIHDKK